MKTYICKITDNGGRPERKDWLTIRTEAIETDSELDTILEALKLASRHWGGTPWNKTLAEYVGDSEPETRFSEMKVENRICSPVKSVNKQILADYGVSTELLS